MRKRARWSEAGLAWRQSIAERIWNVCGGARSVSGAVAHLSLFLTVFVKCYFLVEYGRLISPISKGFYTCT